MDANNFKNVFKNMFLNKKRGKDETIITNYNEGSQNVNNIDNSSNKNIKKYVRYSDIIEQKLKENNKKDEILRNFEDLMDYKNDVISKVAEKQKLKKKFEEDYKKLSVDKEIKIIENKPDQKAISRKTNSLLVKQFDDKNFENDNKDQKNLDINVFSSDSEIDVNENEKYSENISCIPNEFELEVCNKQWVVDVDPKNAEFKKSPEGRQQLGIYKQCRGYIKPLLRLLKRKEVSKEIMNNLFEVMVHCLDRDYVRAHDKYIELAIGNAPWPMGVTMVGIHERSGRSRIFKSQVAHILNDDNTKKYLQSVKRIMSLVQRIYPTNPSNSVFS